ncbi:hypothetical protein VCHE25_2316 [Vibrio cholerae HE-25]|nr:hypothetical protein VCHE25_2316 [Vibrio cholerae HE-25]
MSFLKLSASRFARLFNNVFCVLPKGLGFAERVILSNWD